MRHPAISLVLGLALAALAGIACGGCVSAQSLRSVYQGVADAQSKIIDGINQTDEACQRLARNAAELGSCRVGRDLARTGLREQLQVLGTQAK